MTERGSQTGDLGTGLGTLERRIGARYTAHGKAEACLFRLVVRLFRLRCSGPAECFFGFARHPSLAGRFEQHPQRFQRHRSSLGMFSGRRQHRREAILPVSREQLVHVRSCDTFQGRSSCPHVKYHNNQGHGVLVRLHSLRSFSIGSSVRQESLHRTHGSRNQYGDARSWWVGGIRRPRQHDVCPRNENQVQFHRLGRDYVNDKKLNVGIRFRLGVVRGVRLGIPSRIIESDVLNRWPTTNHFPAARPNRRKALHGLPPKTI